MGLGYGSIMHLCVNLRSRATSLRSSVLTPNSKKKSATSNIFKYYFFT
jgi:hypothetical protein